MKQRTKEWFEARKNRVTGSSAGAILGVSPFMNRSDVMRRMVRDYHGKESEHEENIAMRYGTANEDGAVHEFTMETGISVDEVGFIPYEDWLGSSPDGLTSDGGVLEVKVPFGKRNDKNPEFKTLSDQPHYYAQVQLEILCSGRSHAWFYQWSTNGTALEKVLPCAQWQADALPRLRQFYAEYLEERDTPGAHCEPLRRIIDTPEAARMVAEYDQLQDAIDNATDRKKELLADMVRIAGDKNAVFAGRNLTLTNRAGSVSYAKAIAALLPDADLEKWRGAPSSFWGLK